MNRWELLHADCRAVMANMADDSVDSVVTDPPYHLTSIVKRFGKPGSAPCQEGTDGAFARASRGFMGQEWDGGDIAFDPALWAEVLRVLKPGGHLVAFSGSRTYHRMAVAIEDAGFEIRDQIMWLYGSGFPKSLDISKALDKAAGAQREVVGVADRYRDGSERQNLGADYRPLHRRRPPMGGMGYRPKAGARTYRAGAQADSG
jgi:DNA modification methylase